MDDPVLLAGDGCTYSRGAIEEHFAYCRQNHKPLTSPKTNLELADPVQALLFENVLARSQVLEFKADKTREWEAAEERWQEWAQGKAGK